MIDTNIYWTIDHILTYNALINIIIGERGVGKSYSTKKFCVKKAINKGRKFIYVRRYETELDLMLDNSSDQAFFKDISKDEDFKNVNFEIKNKVAYADGKEIGYFLALSRQSHYKSIPYPDVDNIIFDEVFIQNNRYLKNEVTQLLELIESVGRLRNIKVFLLSNMISLVNPYFLTFDLSLPYKKEVKLFKEGTILLCYIKNEKYRAVKRESTFGKLIKGTKYERYAIDNIALNDSNSFIKKKSRGSYHLFNIVVNGVEMGVWNDPNLNIMVVSRDIVKTCPILLSFDYNSHTEKTTLARTKSPYFKSMITNYSNGLLYFEKMDLKEIVLNLMSKYLY